MSLRIKLTLMFLAIAIIPLLFVNTMIFHNYKDSIEKARISALQDITVYKSEKIEEFFVDMKRFISIVQGAYVVKQNLPVLNRLASTPDNPKFIAANEMLDAPMQNMQSAIGIVDIMLVNPDGKIIYSTNLGHRYKDFGKILPDFHKETFEEGSIKIHFSDIFMNKMNRNRPGILITGPVFDSGNNFIGEVAFEADIELIYKLIMDQTGLGNTGETLLVKKEGDNVVYLNPLRFDTSAAFNKKLKIGSKTGIPAQEAAQGRNGAGVSIDYRGEKVVAAWRHIPTMGWGIVAKIDEKEAFADVTNLEKLAMIILLIVSILAGVMAFSVAKSISYPIQKLSEGVKMIGNGNLDFKVGTVHKDEIGQLSRTFDKMVLDLKTTTASRDELNREIAERKQFEEALRDSEIKYRRLFESAKDGILILDAGTGMIVDVNPFLIEMLGYAKEQFLGKKVWELGFFKDIVASQDNFLELQKKKYIRYEDLPLETADGQRIEVEFVSNVYFVENKKVVQCNIRNISDRKRIENSLRESQADLNRAQAVAQIGSWRMNVQKNELIWSAENHRIFGIPAGTAMTYETFLSTIHPDDVQHIDQKWKAALKGEPYDVEHRIIVGGKIKWVRERAHLELDNKGTLLGGFGTTQDVTELKAKEEELHRLNRILKALSHSDQAMMRATTEREYMNEVCRIIVEDCGHKMVWIGLAENDENKSVFPVAAAGFEEGYLETLNITWADTKRGRGPTGTAIRTGEICFCKNMLTDPKFSPWREEARKRGFASSVVLPLMDRNKAFGAINIYSKEPDSFSGNEMDLLSELVGDLSHGIMELRLRKRHLQAEEALSRSEKRYRALFDGMTEGFALHEIICNGDGKPSDYRFLEVNPAFEELTGLKRRDVLYRTFNEILPGDDPKWVNIYGNVALTGEPIEFENYSSVLKKYYHVFAYCPAPRQFATILMDISERKKAEEVLMRDKETLERIVKERSEKLFEIQVELGRAKRLSDIGTLASTVAHELRNPLAAITMSAAIIRRKTKNEIIDGQIRNIDKMVTESDQIINNLLFYSRLRSPHHENVVIYEIIYECVENLSRQIKKNIQFKSNFESLKEVIMSADPLQLKEVFHNLLHNAADAVPDDCGEVEILASDHLEFVKIHIKDNGHGIDAQHKDRIFDPFFTTKAKGTGLGLTVCSQIVNMHAGSIDIESEHGNGTTVTIILPKQQRATQEIKRLHEKDVDNTDR